MEKEIRVAPFYVGQQVVALEDGICPMTLIQYRKKGNIYTVLSIEYCCPLSGWRINHERNGLIMEGPCTYCYKISAPNKFLASMYAPIIEISDTTVEQVLESMNKPNSVVQKELQEAL